MTGFRISQTRVARLGIASGYGSVWRAGMSKGHALCSCSCELALKYIGDILLLAPWLRGVLGSCYLLRVTHLPEKNVFFFFKMLSKLGFPKNGTSGHQILVSEQLSQTPFRYHSISSIHSDELVTLYWCLQQLSGLNYSYHKFWYFFLKNKWSRNICLRMSRLPPGNLVVP